jgi:peptidoglycan/LPS O-acetylase OafA/YrhL
MNEPAAFRKVIPHHIAALDGLRAFAILAVILHHCGEYYLLQKDTSPTSFLYKLIENLGSGVDLFFALSGFLITGILLDSLQRPYYFQRFYWRRGLRIWPLYYAFLLGAILVHGRIFKGIGFPPFALYYRNFLGPDPVSDVYIGQFWSLCVEEQFYLVWPFVLFFLPRKLRLPGVISLGILALALRIILHFHGVIPYVLYRLPYCHMDVLLAGAAVAVLARKNIEMRRFRVLCWTAILSGLLITIGLNLSLHVPAALGQFGLTGTALLFGGVVGLCVRGNRQQTPGWLGSPFLRAISTRSYAMYVFHLIPLYASVVLISHKGLWPVRYTVAIPLIAAIGITTYGMAWISWKFFEEPILRLKKWEWFAKTERSSRQLNIE